MSKTRIVLARTAYWGAMVNAVPVTLFSLLILWMSTGLMALYLDYPVIVLILALVCVVAFAFWGMPFFAMLFAWRLCDRSRSAVPKRDARRGALFMAFVTIIWLNAPWLLSLPHLGWDQSIFHFVVFPAVLSGVVCVLFLVLWRRVTPS